MGLDLYCGTLTRYHSGGWELKAAKVFREAGIELEVVYPGEPPHRLPAPTARDAVLKWRAQLQASFPHLIKESLDWPEYEDIPYYSDKPDHDGWASLVLACAYAENPELQRPLLRARPDDFETDPAYAIISRDYFGSYVSVLECHLFLPSNDNFLVNFSDIEGVTRYITTTANLHLALETVNGAFWRAGDEKCAEWLDRGAVGFRTATVQDGKLIDWRASPYPIDSFNHSAQFAYAIYRTALDFSNARGVPIVMDQ